ncbi:recombination regulator RecX [Tepidimonas taiwanensis]|uniref:recombination regulator RecX n=1 Tax=Tepidimonas taiwanensis TaxID=307486 RepID=UPI00073416DC|nr:recombination regulator RecX [Tepidimonas taiwanensis]
MARALRALARREYTRAELARRLAPHASDADALAAVLDACAARGWLDEQRAAEAHVRRRGEAMGSARLRAELRERGVSGEALDAALQPLAATEAERARALWTRRFGAAPRDAAERARQMRFLAARGFAADVVRRTVPPVSPGGDATEATD